MTTRTRSVFDPNITSYYLKTFTGLDLSGQSLKDIEFESCSFIDCNFTDAVLRGVRLIECSFTDCRLNHVKLPSARFRGVVMERCKAVGINWTTVEWSRLSRSSELTFRQCVLTESVFFGLSLEDLVMQSCKAHAVDLREAQLKNADLSFTDFSDALFGRTNLTGADFTEATNFDIDVLNNVMKASKFSRLEAARLLAGLDIEIVD